MRVRTVLLVEGEGGLVREEGRGCGEVYFWSGLEMCTVEAAAAICSIFRTRQLRCRTRNHQTQRALSIPLKLIFPRNLYFLLHDGI